MGAASSVQHKEEDWSWTRLELGRFRVVGVDVVGVGAHCVVRRGVDESDEAGRSVAVKEYNGKDAADRVAREVARLSLLHEAAPESWVSCSVHKIQ